MDVPNKTNFDHSVITSEFLNEWQDYALARTQKFIPIDESHNNEIPATSGTVVYIDLQAIALGQYNLGNYFFPTAGDVLIGCPSGRLAIVQSDDGQSMKAVGLGLKIGS